MKPFVNKNRESTNGHVTQGTPFTTQNFRIRSHFSGHDLTGQCFTGQRITRSTLSNLICASADFSNSVFLNTIFDQVNFRGADLSGTFFDRTVFRHVDFTKADLTAADFDDVTIGAGIVDFTHSSIMADQMEQLRYQNHSPASVRDDSTRGLIAYQQFTLDQIVDYYDVNKEDILSLLWDNGITPHDNETYSPVPYSKFDETCHHIPQWEIDGLSLPMRVSFDRLENFDPTRNNSGGNSRGP